ncbi:MAG: exosortase C-terminal domain/associated protein EpsI [Myxococcota bacterium]
MRGARPLAAVFVCLLLPLASFGLVRSRGRVSPAFDPSLVPARLGAFEVARSEELSEDVRAMVAPDAYLLRLYSGRAGAPVWAYVAFYDRAGAKGAHDPAVCYPAQGWDLVGLRERALELPGGETLHARFLAATQGPSEELVLYWFQPAGRWPSASHFEPLLRAVDGLLGRSRYAFVRLSTRVAAPGAAEAAAAETQLVALARELAAPVRSAVRGEP